MENILHETKVHGKLTFPYMVYRGQLPEYIQSFPVHWHKEMEIIYVVNGQGTVTVQTTRYNLCEGDIILIQPETLHSIEQLDDKHMEYFNIIFDFNLLENNTSYCYINYLKPIYERRKTVPVYIKEGEPLSALITLNIRYLIENRKQKFSGDELMVKSNLYAIIHHINKFCTETSDFSLKLESNYNKIEEVLTYVQEHYSEKLTVENAATLISYSPNYFSKLFHELTGTSFIQYVINYRLDIAHKKLTSSDMSITEIAEETGFSNLPYFTRTFTAKYGTTPKAYRKLIHNNLK
ncbi:MAG: AraC family transcriptional regulator [Ruminococcus sp.]|nr:AraC family transcriptional regulator [Ruminococcus sp.]